MIYHLLHVLVVSGAQTRFVQMSVSYVACDAYRCEDTCQHFILVTGLFILLAVKPLTLVEQANRYIFVLDRNISFLFQYLSS